MTLTELKAAMERGDLSAKDAVAAFRDEYLEDCKHPQPLNCYIEFFDDALAKAEKADAARAKGEGGGLCGLPLAVKDNILVEGKPLTCASGVLKGFTAPYSATVVDRLVSDGMIVTGRTNMDEFGMGSSCEYSIYGPTRNPVDRELTPGGSSGGSAAAVASRMAPAALGTETGGSVRLPAAFCGVYGLKPSYGTLSRYGVVAFGSSLDQIGMLARSPDDIALLLASCSGADRHDATSEESGLEEILPLRPKEIGGVRAALPEEFFGEGIDPEIKEKVKAFASYLERNGAVVEPLSLPILKSAVAMYYIIAPAEASSNLARYDGIRYGFRSDDAVTLEDLYTSSRSKGFGKEVKRRIFLGNYVLSSGYYDAYYKKAQQVRTILCSGLAGVFDTYDIIVSPTSPCTPFRIGEKVDDPLSMYLTDICTTFVNLALLPSLSVPCGKTRAGLPVGVQIVGKRFSEALLLGIAKTYHESGGT
ncbi:MAG: Asp-tRNA(Asn)/Glu-tRNA(Gln) amidotransferase subunit GatA [Spirochaetales bacterium]|nr:Asp-tRNA(Asn)/Glu-tRNA(Gln) amidotransferase subunit GatA [Spirochaetales bacterium]